MKNKAYEISYIYTLVWTLACLVGTKWTIKTLSSNCFSKESIFICWFKLNVIQLNVLKKFSSTYKKKKKKHLNTKFVLKLRWLKLGYFQILMVSIFLCSLPRSQLCANCTAAWFTNYATSRDTYAVLNNNKKQIHSHKLVTIKI